MAESFISSVFGSAQAEYMIKKSRFIASVQEVKSEDEAAAFVESMRKKYWDARHNCYAYQLGPGGKVQKCSDDGEPAGTAGRPMLDVLRNRDITNTVVVVTRYFGGIKLGASGLIRAYTHTTVLGLDSADIADYKPFDVVDVTVGYPFVSTMERMAPDYGIRIHNRSFSDVVTFTLQIPQEKTERFTADFTNSTNGQAVYEKLGVETIPIVRPKSEETGD